MDGAPQRDPKTGRPIFRPAATAAAGAPQSSSSSSSSSESAPLVPTQSQPRGDEPSAQPTIGKRPPDEDEDLEQFVKSRPAKKKKGKQAAPAPSLQRSLGEGIGPFQPPGGEGSSSSSSSSAAAGSGTGAAGQGSTLNVTAKEYVPPWLASNTLNYLKTTGFSGIPAPTEPSVYRSKSTEQEELAKYSYHGALKCSSNFQSLGGRLTYALNEAEGHPHYDIAIQLLDTCIRMREQSFQYFASQGKSDQGHKNAIDKLKNLRLLIAKFQELRIPSASVEHPVDDATKLQHFTVRAPGKIKELGDSSRFTVSKDGATPM